MINHTLLLLLSNSGITSARACQHACRLFAEYDLSVPRQLIPQALDNRFAWSKGSAQRLLNFLTDNQVLVSLSRGRHAAGGAEIFVLAASFSWTPKSLMDQWQRVEEQDARTALASPSAAELQ